MLNMLLISVTMLSELSTHYVLPFSDPKFGRMKVQLSCTLPLYPALGAIGLNESFGKFVHLD